MANTEHIEAKLCAYVDNELDAQGRAEIEQHLASNPQHRQLLGELIQQRDLLRGLPRETAGEDIYENFTGQLERSSLLDSDFEEDEVVAGRISHWPQVYAAAAVLLLAVGLAAVIYFVLPKQPAHRPDFAIAPTTTGPLVLSTEKSSELLIDPDRVVARAKPSFSGSGNAAPLVAAPTQLNDETRRPIQVAGHAGALGNFSAGQDVFFTTTVNQHVNRVTNGAVNNAKVVVLNSVNPEAAQHRVTQYLGSNKYNWQKLDEPMPEAIGYNQPMVMSRTANVAMRLKTPRGLAGGEAATTTSSQPAFDETLDLTQKLEPASQMVRSGQLILVRNLTPRQVEDLNQCVLNLQGSAQGDVSTIALSGSAAPAREYRTQEGTFARATTTSTAPLNFTWRDPAAQAAAPAPVNASIAEPATAPATTTAAVLHAGDIVSFSTATSPELAVLNIDSAGQINIQSLGRVTIAGWTVDEAQERIAKLYQQAGLTPGNVSLHAVRMAASQPAATQPSFIVKAGNELEVSWDYLNPDLRRVTSHLVSEEGIIKLPLLGEFQTAGKTPREVAQAIAEAASRYDAGAGTFVVTAKDASGRSRSGSAETTTFPEVFNGAATQPSSQPDLPRSLATTFPTTLSIATSLPASSEPRVDVVIVLQPDGDAPISPATEPADLPRALPATQQFDIAASPAPATTPATAPVP
ncbi:MAG TPA: polysaccharide biosynthesis/export family protein [Tepidisphaeraceae bacterium]